jgi:hypothetical protein
MLEFTARTNLKLRVSNYQIEILLGCLLGDAYITKSGKIQFEQSIKQFPYLMWKYNQLNNLAYGKPTFISRFDKRYGKKYESARFWMRQYFRPLREKFYPEGNKIFPTSFQKYFTDLALAVWYMDDGNIYNRNVKISADGFDSKSREVLKDLLFKKFGLESTVQNSGKIRISNESVKRFLEIVKPHIHSSMLYKIL